MNLSVGNIRQLAFQQHLFQGSHLISKHLTLKMIVLMLDDAGHIAVELAQMILPILICIADRHFRLTGNLFMNIGQTQAAFVEDKILANVCVCEGNLQSIHTVSVTVLFLPSNRK